jgi:hypothetical protein
MAATAQGKPPLPSFSSPAAPAGEPESLAVPEPEPDPYDALWDPDMDTRPERIRRARARKPDGRARGAPRKRRDG